MNELVVDLLRSLRRFRFARLAGVTVEVERDISLRASVITWKAPHFKNVSATIDDRVLHSSEFDRTLTVFNERALIAMAGQREEDDVQTNTSEAECVNRS